MLAFAFMSAFAQKPGEAAMPGKAAPDFTFVDQNIVPTNDAGAFNYTIINTVTNAVVSKNNMNDDDDSSFLSHSSFLLLT